MLKKFSPKSCRLKDNETKHGIAYKVKKDNIIKGMRFSCWITKAGMQTHTQDT
jgi:hypothetical protein